MRRDAPELSLKHPLVPLSDCAYIASTLRPGRDLITSRTILLASVVPSMRMLRAG